MKKLLLIIIFVCQFLYSQEYKNDTFKPLKYDKAPQTIKELWKDFDPRKEPLDTEILYEWEEDNVVMKVIRYRVGIFKGQIAMMAAIYGYPKGAANLPGLVQIHGGGQFADYRAVLTNAKRGYTTISVSWAGRINAPDYNVNHDIVKLFMNGETTNPEYKITTDWGAVDGYHDPCRNPENDFGAVSAASWTLDSIESPRNNSWFLSAVGARRALTFLEQQPEVNPDKLGVYGHSMGGKLTVLTSIDKRVKAAAPSCGGISDRHNKNLLYQNTIADNKYLKNISCPIFFLSPSNDFHGTINDLQKAITEINSDQWRVNCTAHHNHQDNAESEVATQLWFDQHLKGTFTCPETPKSSLELKTENRVPVFSVTPDDSKEILYVDVFYTQQGVEKNGIESRENRIHRFWHYAKTTRKGNSWTAHIPLLTLDRPLWVYANVVYKLDEPVTGAGYYYRIYKADKFNLSSKMHIISPKELMAADVKATMKPSLIIEDFRDDWRKNWFTYRPEDWALRTHKVYNYKWKAPTGCKLAFHIKAKEPNKLVVGIDGYATEVQIFGGQEWQKIILTPHDFLDVHDKVLPNWEGIMELRLGAQETLKINRDDSVKPKVFGSEWKGAIPEFKNLKWIK